MICINNHLGLKPFKKLITYNYIALIKNFENDSGKFNPGYIW